MKAQRDHLPVLAAIGLLAYASADIAHHAAGHGGMCLAQGGHIALLSSIFLDCSVRGTTVDLAGPFANLILGLAALAAAHPARRTLRLFLALVAGFNLLWFALQLAFSAATRSDDFAWAMIAFNLGEPARYGLIAMGLALYLLFIRLTAKLFAPFGPARTRRMVWTAWLTAGSFACFTALLDAHPVTAILYHAAPQSFGLAAGLLLVPRWVPAGAATAPAILPSRIWIGAALIVAALSLLILGRGVAV